MAKVHRRRVDCVPVAMSFNADLIAARAVRNDEFNFPILGGYSSSKLRRLPVNVNRSLRVGKMLTTLPAVV
ncbi:MAG: hypothetical protein GXY83_18830 [Rhodopirellula sp.]|nr:hypothetical protein [Rhodopirellula sp.]